MYTTCLIVVVSYKGSKTATSAGDYQIITNRKNTSGKISSNLRMSWHFCNEIKTFFQGMLCLNEDADLLSVIRF